MGKRLLFITMTLIAFTSLAISFNYSQRMKQATMAICEHTRTTTTSELTCGIVQDTLKTDYICKERNMDSDNQCWVKVQP